MREPAYIAIAEDGALALFRGDGREAEKTIIAYGRRVEGGPALIAAVEALRDWAEGQGYDVCVPAYDLEAPAIPLDLPPGEEDAIDLDDVYGLLDDLADADSR